MFVSAKNEFFCSLKKKTESVQKWNRLLCLNVWLHECNALAHERMNASRYACVCMYEWMNECACVKSESERKREGEREREEEREREREPATWMYAAKHSVSKHDVWMHEWIEGEK